MTRSLLSFVLTFAFLLLTSSVCRRHLPQSFAQFVCQRALTETPGPVAFGARGRVRAEVFGDDGQFAASERFLQRAEEVAARSLDPATALRGLVLGRHFPDGREAAEVVEAHNVRHLQSLAHALDPPLETVRAHT